MWRKFVRILLAALQIYQNERSLRKSMYVIINYGNGRNAFVMDL